MEVDTQGIKVGDFADLICDHCKNAPLTYYCPMCDFKACVDCLGKCFQKKKSGALVCRNCGYEDIKLDTFVTRPVI